MSESYLAAVKDMAAGVVNESDAVDLGGEPTSPLNGSPASAARLNTTRTSTHQPAGAREACHQDKLRLADLHRVWT